MGHVEPCQPALQDLFQSEHSSQTMESYPHDRRPDSKSQCRVIKYIRFCLVVEVVVAIILLLLFLVGKRVFFFESGGWW